MVSDFEKDVKEFFGEHETLNKMRHYGKHIMKKVHDAKDYI